jgi:6-pyruvoyltetrahydropterin/6-carboxytetrahydropterin synthase
MGEINLRDIIFSKDIKNEWSDNRLWSKLLEKEIIVNPKRV